MFSKSRYRMHTFSPPLPPENLFQNPPPNHPKNSLEFTPPSVAGAPLVHRCLPKIYSKSTPKSSQKLIGIYSALGGRSSFSPPLPPENLPQIHLKIIPKTHWNLPSSP